MKKIVGTKPTRHNWLTIFFHWAGALLILLVLLTGEIRHLLVNAGLTEMRTMMVIHIGAGMAGLCLVLPRLLARLFGARPPYHDRGLVEKLLVKAVHLMLYAFLIAEPMIGWLIVNAKGMAIPMPLTAWEFPRLADAEPLLVEWTVAAHSIMARIFYLLIGGHAGAALWHHYGRKDDVLCHMTWL
ncbi:MAG: hypothetical protein JWP38_728 [Herbaspirillum sp.]|nr:hypothetical protein [Herbaspirillum sp.]